MMKRYFVATCILSGILLLAGCNSLSLAADVTPPPDYVAPNPASGAQPVEASTAFPLLPPDPAKGAAIYTEKCLPCHGATGLGDGFQATNLPAPPPAIGKPEIADQARPIDWYTIVTNGRLDKFMPGFTGSLSDRDRWDVVAYVLTLSTTPAQLEQGKVVYEAQCAACHGPQGKGDGASAGADVPDWTDQARLARLSSAEISALVASGVGSMPAFSDLNPADLAAVTAYSRSLTFAAPAQENAAQVTPQATQTGAYPAPTQSSAYPAPTQAAGTQPTASPTELAAASPTATAGERRITLTGKIANSAGQSVPQGSTVRLMSFEGMNQVGEETTQSTAEGTYTFKNVTVKEGMAYMVRVDANATTYNSDILHAADITTDPFDFAVNILDSTTDTSTISADRLHVFFDFTVPGSVQVVELYIISNTGEKVVVPAAAGQPVLTFKLPAGATNLQFESGAIGDRYTQTADGFGDTAAIAPGASQHQVLFSYELPYDRKMDLTIPVSLNVSAAVIMMPKSGVSLTSDQLMAAGEREVQGTTFELFTASSLTSGTELQIRLDGKARAAAASAAGTNSSTGLVVGIGAFGLTLVAVGVLLMRRRRPAAASTEEAAGEPESEEALLDEILTLDDQYQAGKLPEEAYRARRDDLKERLRNLKG